MLNHLTKGKNYLLNLLEASPDTHLRKLIIHLLDSKQLNFYELLKDPKNITNMLIIELLTSRLESLDKKTLQSDITVDKNLNFFNEKEKEDFYKIFEKYLDESKAEQIYKLKIDLRKKISNHILKRFGLMNI